MVVNTFLLSVAFSNQTGFVALNATIRVVFDLKYPLTADGRLTGWQIGDAPSVIQLKSTQFRIHGITPIRIFNSFMIKRRFNVGRKRDSESFKRGREFMIGERMSKRERYT